MQPLGADEPVVVGPYRLLGRLGAGGMGRVYLGRSAGGRTVAVKIVHPHFALDEEFRARFRREVDAARRVGGAWTAPVLDADPDAAVPWVATAYAAGPSLAAAVGPHGQPLPGHTVRVLGAGLAEALTAVHDLGLVHRDVKPSNVLLTMDGPLLIDFGIARATDGTASLTSTGVSVGSPGYMAPEQILGRGASGAADVFSLGAVLAYAAAGAPPFRGDTSAALLYKVVHEQPELGELAPGELRDVVEACLAKDPAARPTPAEAARRLAPQGAARLVTAGWLPGPLVEQVGRSAVQLLNLEAAATGPGAAPTASGPVGFDGVAVESVESVEPVESVASDPATATGGRGTDPAADLAAAHGTFGPAPVMPGSRTSADAPAGPPGGGASTVVPAPRGDRPGKVSVTVAAGVAPGDGGRGRRLSCTVALAVAGALAAVTLGSAVVFDLVPGDDRDSGAAGAQSSPPAADTGTPGASTGPSGPGPSSPGEYSPAPTASGGPGGALPARYVGTWEGEGSGLGGTLPMGTFRVTLHRATVGQRIGELRQTDVLGSVCVDLLTLKQVSASEVVAASAGAASNHSGCNPTPHTVRLVPTGDDLTYRSDSAAEGEPVARMARVR
ncbi:serine/threonine-protein kinase [Streptomyces galbus]|uniref:Serine/threonine protein kinase n=1 Tax=Streptomyces galbus TaxID=33898 RepID=A0A4V6AX79_STRGB|nr:serine/threonine-protein kinase [Streptomyces galbus]TKT06743.1 serine/threonine protein kinase [Streptomyces galbus]